MKTFAVFYALTLFLLPGSGAFAVEAPPLTAAVFNFQASNPALTSKGAEASVLLNAQLAKEGVDLVEREELEKVLAEQELSLSGNVTPGSAAKVGALIGAKVLITGRWLETGGKNYLVAKIIGSETSRVFGEIAPLDDAQALEKATGDLAHKIAVILQEKGPALVAAPEDPEARMARLRQAVAGRRLPSVSIAVSEQHVGRPVIDPAVQTELMLTLQQLGFEVIDAKPGAKAADVMITGEAFSQVGARRGALISCRARVELKGIRASDGKVLFTDRQTEGAVDTAENIAGKTALEIAARKLLDRFAPQLAAN